MFRAIREIHDYFLSQNLKVEIVGDDSLNGVPCIFTAKGGLRYAVVFCSNDDTNGVAVRVFNLAEIRNAQYPSVLSLINRLNSKYRYIKFYCDDDGLICASADMLQEIPNIGECAYEMLTRFVQIIEEEYSAIMRAVL